MVIMMAYRVANGVRVASLSMDVMLLLWLRWDRIWIISAPTSSIIAIISLVPMCMCLRCQWCPLGWIFIT